MYFWLKKHSIVNFLTPTLVVRLCLFMATLLSFSSAQAVNISTYRIYLDEDNRDISFIIFNRDASYQDCKLNLVHNSFDADSTMHHLPENTVPENSAKDWIRFSPREFVLTPSQSQTVRFNMRRKANAEDAEYRSYLLIDCGIAPSPDEEGKPKPQTSLLPKLVISVPIIVRSGELDASVWFDNFQATNDGLNFSLNRKGGRSVYGNVEVVNKETDEIIFTRRNVAIYPESQRFNFTMKQKNIDINDLKFRFIENKEYGGDILLEQDAR